MHQDIIYKFTCDFYRVRKWGVIGWMCICLSCSNNNNNTTILYTNKMIVSILVVQTHIILLLLCKEYQINWNINANL